MRRRNFKIVSVLGLGASSAITAGSLAPQNPERMGIQGAPAAPLPAFRTLDAAVEYLSTEAAAAFETRRLPHAEADFAARATFSIPPADLSTAMIERQHDDPFVDAYVRWQLTSLASSLPEMDDVMFLRAMDAAPALLEHPRAAQGVLNMAALVKQRGALSAGDTEKLREYLDSVNHDSMIFEELNRPAREWREWVTAQLGDNGHRPRLWMVEDLAARIRAGWPVSELKADISRDFTRSVDDASFTAEQRHEVILHMTRLIGPGRQYLHDVAFFAGGRVEVSLRTVAVDRDDVENWRKRLAGIRID